MNVIDYLRRRLPFLALAFFVWAFLTLVFFVPVFLAAALLRAALPVDFLRADLFLRFLSFGFAFAVAPAGCFF